MNALFIPLRKKVIDQFDRTLASDYISYYGVDPTEMSEYADEFVAVCYKFNEETGEHEPRTPDELPFADVNYLENGMVSYKYGDCTVTKLGK